MSSASSCSVRVTAGGCHSRLADERELLSALSPADDGELKRGRETISGG